MLKKMMLTCVSIFCCLALAVQVAGAQTNLAQKAPAQPAAAQKTPAPKASLNLTAEQVIAKNIEARGGLQAWRAIQTMTESGKLDAGSKANPQLPFRLQLARQRKSRLEIDFDGNTAVQTYDGSHGWALRPYLGRTEPQPYTADELKKAAEQQDLDGPLFDYAAKGTKVELVAVEPVEKHDAYKVKMIYSTGVVRHVWIDANTFLEIKMEEPPRVMDGKPRPVLTYYRDYRTVDGLVIPFLYETAVEGYGGTHKMVVEKVELNPKLDSTAFGKPASLPPNALLGKGHALPPAVTVPQIKKH